MLKVLNGENIPTMVVKGLPLSLAYYRMPALRPMNDIDVVVPVDHAVAASSALIRAGFAAPNASWKVDLVLRHALQHIHPDKGEVDLHWHVLFECPRQTCEDHFWSKATPLNIGQEKTLQPCPTDLLLQVMVHGIRWNPFPPMRWITDAATILRSANEIDWGRVIAFGHSNQLGKRLALGTSYLRNQFDLPIPEEVVTELAARSGLLERAEFFGMRGADARSGWRHLRRATFVFRLLRSDRSQAMPSALFREALRRSRRYFVRKQTAS
jgi:hypothetical protein